MKIVISSIFYSLLLTTASLTAQTLNGTFENKFKRYVINASYTGQAITTWNTKAWKGERITNQIILWTNGTVNNLQVTATDFHNVDNSVTIPSSSVSFKYGVYAKGDALSKDCGGYATRTGFVQIIDALSDQPVNSLDSNDPLKLWAVVQIPSNIPKGTYTGKIIATGGNSQRVEFAVNINVADLRLPDLNQWTFHLDLWQYPSRILKYYNDNSSTPIALWSDAHFALLEPFYRTLADCGQKAITAQIKDNALGEPTMVKWIKKTNGNWEYDFSVFDRFVSKMMEWGINGQINCFSPIGWNTDEIPYYDEASQMNKTLTASYDSPEYITRWGNFLTAFKAHLDTKGWFEKTVLFFDEISEDKVLSVLNNVIIPNNPAWKVGAAITHDFSSGTKDKLYDLSGVLYPSRTFDNSGFDNKIFTFYTSCSLTFPNSYVTRENSTAEMTWVGWYAANANYKGFLRWAYDNWQMNDPSDARDKANTAGDFSIVYRSANTGNIACYPSLRLMMLRDGIQDFEKIRILQNMLQSDPVKLQQLNSIVSRFTKISGEDEDIETNINQAKQDLATLSEDLISGITKVNLREHELQIYPNPASEQINFSISDEKKILSIRFFNILGAEFTLARTNTPTNNFSYPVNNLPLGVYHVSIATDKGVYNGAFIRR